MKRYWLVPIVDAIDRVRRMMVKAGFMNPAAQRPRKGNWDGHDAARSDEWAKTAEFRQKFPSLDRRLDKM